LNAIILLVFGTDVRSLSVPSSFELQMVSGSITGIQGAMFAVLFVAFVLAVVFFRLTKVGIAMRATASNEQLGRVVGVNSDKMVSISYVVGSLFVGLGAVFLVFVENIGPGTGGPIVLKAFTATVVGGLGSFRGALLGSLLVGYVEVTAILLLPTGYNEGIVFALLFVFLLGRPNGLFVEGHLWN
jgi:branched-chain amino acid transport system permease protein